MEIKFDRKDPEEDKIEKNKKKLQLK